MYQASTGNEALRGETGGPSELQKIEDSFNKDLRLIVYKFWIIFIGIVRALEIAWTLLYNLAHLKLVSIIITCVLGALILYIIWIAYEAFRLRDTKKQKFVMSIMRIYLVLVMVSVVCNFFFGGVSLIDTITGAAFGFACFLVFYYLAEFALKTFERRDQLMGKV